MNLSRRSFILASVCFGLAPSFGQAAEMKSYKPNPDESKAIAYMIDRGIQNFVMLNKTRGKIMFVENGLVIDDAPALSGKLKGDTHRKDLDVTPAGIHILRSYHDNEHIGFMKVDGTNTDYMIHTVISPRGQNRPARLKSNRPEWQRISSGCVNVSQETLDKILRLMDKTEFFRDTKNEPYVAGSFFVVLPEIKPVETILKYPEYTFPR